MLGAGQAGEWNRFRVRMPRGGLHALDGREAAAQHRCQVEGIVIANPSCEYGPFRAIGGR